MRHCLISILVLAAFPSGPVAAEPVAWSGGVTAVGQAASDADLDAGATASADLIGELTSGIGRWTLFIEGSTAPATNSVAARIPESNGDAGSALDDRDRGRVQVSELKLALPVFTDSVVTVGLIDPPSYVDQSRFASDENTQFLGTAFVQNPTIGFPDYTLGAVYELPVHPGSTGFTALVSSSHGLADAPGRTYRGLADVGDHGRGVFAAMSGGWRAGTWRTRLGVWVNTADYERLDGTGVESNYGIYLLQGAALPAGDFSIRAGLANPQVSLGQAYLAVTWRRTWSDWVLGLGAAETFASSDAPANTQDSVNAEMYLRWTVRPGVFLTPALQFFRNPSLDASGTAVDRSVGVGNLRLTWLW